MDENALIQAMMQKGHSESTARGAIAGRGVGGLWNEYMGGSSGSGSSGSSSSGDFQPVSAVDFAALEEQAFQMLKPYYEQVIKESRGDFNRATQIVEEDYIKGVRIAHEDYGISTGRTEEDRRAELGLFDLDTTAQREQKIDELNRRGMAVGQMGPDMQPQVLTGGRGGYEYSQWKQGRDLRREAINRTKDRELQDYGIDLNRYTSVPVGTDPTAFNPLGTADRTKLGKAELTKVRGREDFTRQQQLKEQQLFKDRRKDAFDIAQTFAGIKSKEIPTALTNRYLTRELSEFKNTGTI